MYPFNKAVTPAAKDHMEAQLSYFNDMSKSLFRVIQQYSELNIQLAQTMLEEGTVAGQQAIIAERPTEAIAAAAAHAQPTAEKLRAYQQHLSRIAADTHVDLAKVAEEHVAETARTAKALADEVARVTHEETEKTVRSQQDAIRQFTDPFERFAEGSRRQQQGRGNEMRGSSTMQSAGQDGEGREGHAQSGSMQGGSHTAAQGAAAAQSGKQPAPRKET
ncbi:phasin family protein [Rugamonas sp. CCM 8940]|uniref:phasin family protein n=1 Tax=Rugamonas sp. CCM 8940 TaxID=2765359 RepID=UPI0018F6F057|nr:phasin family protein [Rugamonas sp. CCM 8940]MBJ7312645.1 TIGR01841 family phasin [Rugamonas sp. CCM 8940]